jgi:OOP family OmpA-OmpF porin
MSDVDYGIGAKYWLTDNFALRFDVRDNMTVDDQIHSIETTLGVVFRFGGNAAATPAPVEAVATKPEPTPPQMVVEVVPPPPVEVLIIPIPAAEPTLEKMKYCVSLNIEFDINKAYIGLQYHDQVARVGDFMRKYPTTTAVIEGYADEVGSDDYNMGLSLRRAESVVKYLIDNFGIDASRLSAKGYGKTRPIADNATDTGKQKNRHIDAIIDCALDVKDLAPLPERLCLTLNVEYATDSAKIDPRYYDELAKVGEYMKKYPTTSAVIEGHTDNTGSAEQNMRLSQLRAENVVNYLKEKFGIESSRLAAKGYGSSRSIAYNNTAEGRRKNRRINAIIDCVIQK